jgi:dipeptidyl aminopeptidase/acylaminoacyl peptidase
LTWFDRTGKSLGNLGEQAIYDNELRLSPDGGRLVTAIGDPSDIWAFDLDRGVRTRLSTEPVEERPVIWSPDGIRIAYISRNRPDKKKILYVKAASGLGAPEPILESDEETVATDWSPDGRFLLVDQAAGADASNIYALSLKGDRVLHPVVATPFTEQGSRFSPDGRWVAYHSDESGRFEAYVVPFCPPSDGDAVSPDCDRTGRWQVSPMGGSRPVWARNGKSLYYEASDLTLTEVSVDGTGDVFHSGAARPLFQPDAAASDLVGRMKRGFGYDVTPDGERFIVNTFGSGDATPLTLVVNWTRLLDAP